MTSPITILVVDSNDQARQSLASELAGYNYGVVEATCEHEALARAADAPDAVIMDMDLPLRHRAPKSDGAGLTIGRKFREVNPTTGLVFYCSDENHVRQAQEIFYHGTGGVGYVSKEASIRLATVIPSVISGNWVCVLTKPFKSFVTEEMYLQGLANTPRTIVQSAAEGIAQLSEEEKQTLRKMGQSNQAIAKDLFVSIKTVENRFTNIYEKLSLEAIDRRLRTILLDRAVAIYNLRHNGQLASS